MFGSSAASRRFLRVRKFLIGLQVILLLFTMIAPVGTIAADPTPAPSESPTPSEPTPSVDPSPSVDPAPSADPTAPPPDPTATPDPTTAPDPSVVPDPTPEPTPDPTPAPVTVAPYIVTFVGGTSAADQAAAIAAAGAVDLDSIPVLRMHAIQASDAAASALRADDSVATVELDRSRAAEAAPDDTAYADQWSLPKIGWDLAYDSISPSGTAIVAILDTGVDGSHSDLVGKLVGGISLLGTDPATDSNGHGTAMAGIVAASTNNGSGIAGVGYAGVKVMPVTVLNSAGLGRDSDIIEGLVWAADHGADVALMAFSASGYSSSLQAAVDYAWSQGVVLVAATGNDGSSLGSFPAGDAGVIGVSSTDQSDALAANSNYGTSTFLAAPGVGIPTLSLGGGVTSVSGTSAAAAHVAAAAALLRAHDAALSNGVVVGRLARTADAAGTAEQTGNGRLNLARALNDVSTEEVKPAGAAPVGDGGPFVGPYVAASNAIITGTVKESGTGNAIVGATVTMTGGDTHIVTTVAGGAYSMPVSYAGGGPITVTLAASAAGYTAGVGSSLTSTCSGSGNGTCAPAVLNLVLVPPSNVITINDVTAPEGSPSGTTAFTFTVSRASVSGISTVAYATSPGTATGGATCPGSFDYEGKSGTITFAAGVTSQTITVNVCRDATFEADETFTVNLSGPTNATISDASGTGTITNDDTAPTLSIADLSAAEGSPTGSGPFTFTVTQSAVSGLASSVNYATSAGTATAGTSCTGTVDYVTAAGTATVAAGATSTTFTVTVCRDATFELDETFTVSLSTPTNATIGDGTGTGTIQNDDTAPTFAINDQTVNEGNPSGTTTMTFTVTKTGTTAVSSTVAYTTTPGTAIGGAACGAGVDYMSTSGTLTFAAGTTTQTIAVTVCRDLVFEANETFTVDLSAPSNATINDGSGLGTINNDDTAPTLSINDVTVAEGNSGTTSLVFTVTQNAASGVATTVNFTTTPGTAAAGSTCPGAFDYETKAGTATVPAGSTSTTISVNVCGDTLFEANEAFSVTLTVPVNATISDGTGTGTITNDDTAPTLSIDDVSAAEGSPTGTTTFTFTVSQSAVSGLATTATFTTAAGTATAGSSCTGSVDYVTTSGTATIAAGSTSTTINVTVCRDSTAEADETFFVNLTSPTNATIADNQGLGTIQNDDNNASLGGTVYNDANGNGTFDVGEVGIAGVTVTLSGTGSGSTTTAANGSYTFTGLAPGTYSIDYSVPGTFVNTGTKPISGIVLGAGGSSTGNNFFAQQRNGSLSGTVYNDANGNGSFDVAEVGLSGVTVTYSGGTPSTSGTTTTNGSGAYTISGLQAGTYSINYTVPTGYINTGVRPLTVILTAGQSSTANNFFAQAKAPALTLDKTSIDTTYAAVGDVLDYSFKLTNTGNVTLSGPFTVADDKATDEACPATATLAPGAFITCTATYTVTQADLDAGSVTNTATGSGSFTFDGDAAPTTITSNSDSVTITATQTPALALDKTSIDTTYAAVGDVLDYSFKLTNTGNVTLSGPFTVADDKATDEACPATATLAPGAFITCTATYTVTQADLDAGSVTNTATGSGSFTFDGDAAPTTITSNSDSVTITATQTPALALDKTSIDTTYAAVGDVLDYSFKLTNTGNVTLSGPFTVADDKATDEACPATATLAPGAFITCTATYTVTQADLDAGSVTNTATGSGSFTFDGDAAPTTITSNSDSVTITATQTPALALDKTSIDTTYAAVGDVLDYSFKLTNTGNVTLSGPFTVADDKATDEACPATATLAPGAFITCTATYTVTQADLDAGSVTNTATGSGSFGATIVTSDSDSVTITATQSPALTLDKTITAGTPYSAVGDTISYQYLVTNTGNVTISGISVSDDTTDATPVCDVTTLAPGAVATCTAVYTTTQADLDAGFVTNNASATGTPAGGDLTDPTDSATAQATQTPSLSVEKSSPTITYAAVGDTLTYSYLVTNTGNVTISGPFSIADDRSSDESCPVTASLAPGDTVTCSATYSVTQADLDAGFVTNTATASGSFTFDGDAAPTPITSDSDSVTITATQSPALTLDKTITAGTPYSAVGDTISYQYLVTNTGNVTISGISVSDDTTDATPVCDVTTLAPGAVATCTAVYTITQADLDAGFVTNNASATGTPAGGDLTDPTDSATAYATQSPALTLDKTITAGTPYSAVGDTISYQYLVTNTGNVTISGISVSDDTTDATPVCDVTTLAPGAVATCTAVYTITQADLDAGFVTNNASATGTPAGGDLTDPTDSATAYATQTPALALDKTSIDTTYAAVGDVLDYSFKLTNTGNVTLSGPFTVADDKATDEACPATATLAPGAFITCTATYTVTQADLDAGSVTNTATGSGSFGATIVTSDSDSVTITATQSPALTLDKTITAGTPYSAVGDTISYQYLVTNTGNVTISGISVSDDTTDATPVCDVTTLAPGAVATCTAVYTITQADLDAGFVTNNASATGTPAGGDLTDPTDSATATGDPDPVACRSTSPARPRRTPRSATA